MRRSESFGVHGERASPAWGEEDNPFQQEYAHRYPGKRGDPVEDDLIQEDRHDPAQDDEESGVDGLDKGYRSQHRG
jgi:hypothetical protein